MKYIFMILGICSTFYSCTNNEDNPMRGTKITSFVPESASALDTVVIVGENFKPVNTNVVIFSDNKIARIITTTPTKLVVIVPSTGVVNGPIKVVVSAYETAVSNQIFKIN